MNIDNNEQTKAKHMIQSLIGIWATQEINLVAKCGTI